MKFKDQIEEKIIGSVIWINKFNVEPNKVEQFLKDWGKMLLTLNNNQDLFLHNSIEGLERVVYFINYAVWESMEHYKKAVNKIRFSPESQSPLLKYDDNSLVISPHLFKKVAVPGICVD